MLFSQFEDSSPKIIEEQNQLSKNSPSVSFLSPYDIISSYLNRQTLQAHQPFTKQFSLYQQLKPQKESQFSAVEQVSEEHNIFDLDDRLSTIKNKPEHGRAINGIDSSDYFVCNWLSNQQVKHLNNLENKYQQKQLQNHLFYGKQNNSERYYKLISQFYFSTNESKVKQLKDMKNLQTSNATKVPRRGIRLSMPHKSFR